MALGIMPASAFAEDTKVFQKAEITVEEPVIGEMPDYSKTITLTPSDFSCSVRVEWKKSSTTNNADYSGWEIMETGETFEAGFYYCVSYCIIPNTDQGMVVYDFPEIYINNKLADTSMEGVEDLEIFATRVFSNLFNVVKNIDVTVDPPVVGEKPDYEPEFTSTPADSVSIKPEIIFWRECSKESYESYENGESDEIDWQDISKDDVFKEGYYYRIEVAFEPNGNYFFTENTKTTVNDKSNGSPIFIGNDFSVACASATFTPLTPGPVTDIYVDVDTPVIGEMPDFTLDYDASIEGGNIDTTDIIELKDGSVKWYESKDGNSQWTEMTDSDTFKEGHYYRIDTAFEPKTPYYFTADTTAYVNYDDCQLTLSSDNSTAYVSATFGPLAPIPITNIRVTVDNPVIGNTPDFTPVDYVASIDGGDWYDNDIIELKDGSFKWYEYDEENDTWDVMADSDTFKEGYYYRIDAEFDPHTGYYFTTDTTAAVNGYRHNGDIPVYDKDSTCAYVSRTFGPLRYGTIDVTSIAATIDTPVIGEKPDYEPRVTSVPEDSVEVYDVKWYKSDKENPSYGDILDNPGVELRKDEKFEEGYFYIIMTAFHAKYGYSLDLQIKPTINGMFRIYGAYGETSIDTYVAFKPEKPVNVDEPITSIAVTFDEPALGGKLNFKPEITADPADSAYQISYSHIWFKCDKERYENDEILSKPWTYQSDGDVFEEGYYYELDMYVKAHDGFYFTADTEGAINGVSYDVANYLADNQISFKAVYGPFSTKPITSIAAKVDAPAIGNTPDFSPEITSAPEGSAEPFKAIWYKLPEDKYTGTADDSWELVAQNEAFKEGYYYSVLVGAVENDGFCFTNDTTATLNGKAHVETLGPVYSDEYEDSVARIYGVFEPLHSQSSSSGGSGGGRSGSINHTLKFNTNGGSIISPVSKLNGTNINLEEYKAEKDGFEFTGWYSNAELTDKITSIKLTSNTTVYAGWKEIEKDKETDEFPFADVNADDWFFEDVAYAYENGLMSGTGADTFSPDAATTRGMIVAILYRLEGEAEVPEGCSFGDVKSGSYYENAIAWAAANGIVSGYDNGMFGPDDPITREQLAAILYRYAQYKGLDVSVGKDTNILSYNDAFDISEYAVTAMQWLCGEGIISGSDGNLMPAGNATRAQVAALLHRFCENVLK